MYLDGVRYNDLGSVSRLGALDPSSDDCLQPHTHEQETVGPTVATALISKPTVYCCFQGPRSPQVLIRAILHGNGFPIPTTPGEIRSLATSYPCSALVIDAAICEAERRSSVAAVRDSRPWLPIMLTVTANPIPRDLVVASDDRMARVLFADPDVDVSDLREDMSSFLRSIPYIQTQEIVSDTLPILPPHLDHYLASALRCLELGQRPKVHDLVRDKSISHRQFQRELRTRELPSAKELLDWVILLHATRLAAIARISVARTGRFLGITSRDCYRIRSRLTATGAALRPDSSAEEIARALADRCRVLRGSRG